MLSVKEIERILEAPGLSWTIYPSWEPEGFEMGINSWEDWHETSFSKDLPRDVPGLGSVNVVESHGGEGQGDRYYMVFSVTNESEVRYFKIDGYYASYAGGEFDGPFTEVHPVTKTVTVYE